jgi:hypothetical protein
MNKIIYLIFLSLIFSSCQKEQGCMEPIALNYNIDAEEDDGTCQFSITGGSWITQSVSVNGTMTASMLGITILDTAISTVENNPDSLQPYKLTFYTDNNFVESDQQDLPVGGGTWSQTGDILTITDQDTTIELIINDISKESINLSLVFLTSYTEDGILFNIDLVQEMYCLRDMTSKVNNSSNSKLLFDDRSNSFKINQVIKNYIKLDL